MAPELVIDNAAQPTPAADVFSFGRLTYFVIAQRKPLARFTKKQVVQAAVAGHAPALIWPSFGLLAQFGRISGCHHQGKESIRGQLEVIIGNNM